jgi:transposase
MTQAERDRLVALKKAKKKLITQREAAEEIGITERQVRRLLRRIKEKGDKAVIHTLRGKPSNRKLDETTEKKAMEILSQPVYRGFGPTLAGEYLLKKHRLEVSKETLRKWMGTAGLWTTRRRRVKAIHQWRQRRSCYGELVQWDTSEHDWLEGRGEKLYLISMIDDATSRLYARFVRHDSTAENMRVLQSYLERFGRPLAFYTDRAGLFQTAIKTRRGEQRPDKDQVEMPPTQIGRALKELLIVWIPAYSPQAKGRVERQFQTAQDRLVKMLRLAGACTLEDANACLDNEYLPWWNETLTVIAANPTDAHRPLGKDHDLAAILSHVEERHINNHMIRFESRTYKIDRECIRASMQKGTVRVEVRLDGSVAVRYADRYVSITLCEPAPPVMPPKRKLKTTASRKGPNTGGKSRWMQDFFQGPSISLKKALRIANATS